MKHFKKIGECVHLVDELNSNLAIENLLGIAKDKCFMPSVANVVGTDLSKYNVIRKGRFACNLMHVNRDEVLPVALYTDDEPAIISPAYPMFEVNNTDELLPEYLNMYLMRKEFDREVVFYAMNGVRGGLEWDDFMEIKMPIPNIDEQLRIVNEYKSIENRIANNNLLIQKLEDTALALYFHFFEDGIDLENLPDGWSVGKLNEIANINMGQSPNGECLNETGDGEIFYQGRTDFGVRYPDIRVYTTEGNKRAKANDILMSVRAPVGDLNITLNDCVIGRGIAAISSKDGYDNYLYYLLLELAIEFNRVNNEGTIFGSITKTELFNTTIVKPSVDVVKEFNNLAQKIDNYILFLYKENCSIKEILKLYVSKLS